MLAIIKDTRKDIRDLTEAIKALCEILGVVYKIDVEWEEDKTITGG